MESFPTQIGTIIGMADVKINPTIAETITFGQIKKVMINFRPTIYRYIVYKCFDRV